MKRIVRIGIILLVAAVLIGAGLLLLGRPNRGAEAEAPVLTTTVARGSIEETVSATGSVVAHRQASLTFASSGQIAAILVEKGQEVEAGQLLARLDTTSLEWQVARSQAGLDTAQARLAQAQKPASEEDLASAQVALDSALANRQKVQEGATAEELASAQAALDSARANYKKVKAGPTEDELASARAALDNARASLQQAQAAYDRVKNQPDVQMRQESLSLQNATIALEQAQANYDGVANRPTASELAAAWSQVAQAESQLAALQDRPSQSEMAAADAQVAQAQAQLATLQQRPNAEDVAIQQAQVEEARIALAQAQSQLEDSAVVAPFAGTLLAVNVNEGEWASPGAPAFVLAATHPLILDVDVDEIDVARLAEGQPAYLSFDALKSLEGEQIVGRVTYIAPSSSNVGGAVAYGLEISFEPGSLPVRLGMTADVDIVVASAGEALLVPNQAIEADREAGRYYVNRQGTAGTVERLEVRIGLRDESRTQILEGVAEGDTLVLPQVPDQTQRQQTFGPGQGGMPFGGGQ